MSIAQQTSDREVRFVSFSIAADDGPRALTRFAQTIPQGNDARWRLLVADRGTFPQLAEQMGLARSVASAARGELELWPSFYLVDRAGQVRALYDGFGADGSRRLLADLATLQARP